MTGKIIVKNIPSKKKEYEVLNTTSKGKKCKAPIAPLEECGTLNTICKEKENCTKFLATLPEKSGIFGAKQNKIIIEEDSQMKLLDDKYGMVEKIVHISDVHIYLPIDNSRYDEYTNVFGKLYEDIEELSKKYKILICITGDLCDKNKLWGREIDFLEKFLTKLCDYAPVITIPGNHDFNYCESDELVHISPIMRNKKLKNNFYLLIENGLYKYNNIIFGVTAVYSDKVIQCDVKDANIKKIALYHGHVFSRAIRGIVPEKGNFRIDDFDGYDMVLLGDIHTACSLTDNDSRWYAGSLIKQRINEPNDHGYILWDIETNKGQLKVIKNKYATVMLEIDENGIKDYDSIEIPTNGRVEAIYKNINFDEAKEKLKDIEGKMGINIEPHLDIEIKLPTNDNKIIKNISDLRNKEGISKVIVEYIKEREVEAGISKDVEYMETIINNIIKDINYNPDTKQKNIKIKSLKFDNFFSYGEGNVIDFEKLANMIVNIYGKNSVGKTSIFDAILLSIYGDCTRGKAIDSINTRKKYMSTEIILSVNDDTFRIVRRRTKKQEYINRKNGKKVSNKYSDGHEKSELKVEIYKNNKLLESNKCGDIDDYINENIGHRDDFIKMCMMLQKDSYNFFDMPDSEQINFIMKFINLDIINIIGDTIKGKINDFTRDENNIYKDYKTKKLDQLKNVLTSKQDQLRCDIKELNDKRNQLISIMSDYTIASNNLSSLNSELVGYNHHDEVVDMKLYNEIKLNYNKKVKEVSIMGKDIKKIYTIKKNNETKLKELSRKITMYDNMGDKIIEFNNNKTKKIEELEKHIYDLHEQKSNIFIKNVKHNAKEIDNKINVAKKELNTLIKNKDNIVKNINKLEKKIVPTNDADTDNYRINKLKYDTIINENNDLLKQYNLLTDSQKKYMNINIIDKLEFNSKCKCCKKNKDNINYIDIMDNYNRLAEEIITIDSKINQNKNVLSNMKNSYDVYVNYEKDIEANSVILREIGDHKKDCDVLDAKIELSRKKVNELENIKYDIQEYVDAKQKIDIISKQIKDTQNELKNVKDSCLDNYNVYMELNNKISQLDISIKNVNNDIIEKTNTEDTLKTEIDGLKKKILEYDEIIEKNSKFISMRDQVLKLNDTISDLLDKRKEYEDIINDLNIKIHNNDCAILENDIKKLDVILYDKAIYNKINLYLMKDVNGIRSTILEKKIFPHLEEIINSFLTQIVDYKIKFRYLGSQRLEIMKKYMNGSDVSLDTRSASEDTVLDIVFRISLAYFNNVIKCNFFIMDEVFSLFDQQRLDIVLTKIFGCLKKYFDVLFIVSQLPEVQIACDNKIIVERDSDGYSKLRDLRISKVL